MSDLRYIPTEAFLNADGTPNLQGAPQLIPNITKEQAMQIFGLVEPTEHHISALRALRYACQRMNDMMMADDGQAWKEANKALPKILAAIPEPDGYLVLWKHQEKNYGPPIGKMNIPIIEKDLRWRFVTKEEGKGIMTQKVLRAGSTDNHPFVTCDIAPLFLA